MVQNIDPVFLLGPILTIAFSVGLVLYWAFRRRFQAIVLVYSLGAYSAAIALKYLVQIPTARPFIQAFGVATIPTGLYYGLQTAFFEVGLAFLVARFAVSRQRFTGGDAGAFGIGLAFWENGVLLGLLSLLNLLLSYMIMAGGSPLSQQVYQQLVAAEPGLFAPPAQALPVVLLSILERLSSSLVHIAWGYLVVMSAFHHRPYLLALALPMGLIDALVPFAGSVPLSIFEGVIFLLSLAFLAISLYSTRGLRRKGAPVASGSP